MKRDWTTAEIEAFRLADLAQKDLIMAWYDDPYYTLFTFVAEGL